MLTGSRWFLRASKRFVRHERGYSVVELAMISPMLAFLLVAAFDFARAFYFAIAVTGAAHTAAQWGSLSPFNATNYSAMQNIAQNHAPGLGVTATASRICRCGSGVNAPSNMLSCSAGCVGTKRVYVSVTTTRSFSPIIGFPGIPGTVNITRTSQIRAE